MPQASEELRDRMGVLFGDRIGDEGPTKFLMDAGYKLKEPDFGWEPKSGVNSLGDMTRDEFECLMFLMHEWDFDGLLEPRNPPATPTTGGTDDR